MTKVTIITPLYNQEQYIEEAITSVVKQNYPNKEMIIVDGGSTDKSTEIVKDLLKNKIPCMNFINGICGTYENTKISLYQTKTKNAGEARNIAIQLGWDSSDVFMNLDGDDYYLPSKITQCIEQYLYDTNMIGIVYNNLLIQRAENLYPKYIAEYRMPYDRTALQKSCIISNTPLISKAALAKVGGYDISLNTCEDWDLYLRITEYFIAVHIPKLLSVYRVTGHNSTDTISQEQWNKNWSRVQEKLHERLKLL